MLFPPPPPPDSANDNAPEPSVCSTCPFEPSEDGKLYPDTVKVPVVVKFSFPKLIAPLESVIDPFAHVKFPIVDPLDPTNEPVIVVPVTAAAVLAPIITLSILDVPVPSIFTAPLAVKPTVVVVPFTCNVVDGSEVPIPTRLFVTSRYSRFVSNARSVPFLVKLDFSTDPDIRPMAILGSPYNNVSTAIRHAQPDIIAG